MGKQERIISGDAGPSVLGDQYSLADVVRGLAQDLKDLRAGRISNADALTRSALAKQYFNGLRLVLVGQKFLDAQARQIEGD